MKAKLEYVAQRENNQSFVVLDLKSPAFEFMWHYHPEYEITYIVAGEGKRYVGDSYEDFKSGDLVALGANISHTWVTDRTQNQNCHAIVIQFTQEFIEPLFQYPEFAPIEKLFAKLDRGLKFESIEAADLMQKISHSRGIDAFILLVELLKNLSYAPKTELSSAHFKPLKGTENHQRINAVFEYVQISFKEKISLPKAASLIHLSESAFCKFFKRATGKTFSEYANEIRLSYSCQLLIETDKPITQIAFESGFDSLSYFNRVFLKKKSIPPSQYRKSVL